MNRKFTTLTYINGEWRALGSDPFPPDPDRASTTPTPQDRQINPNPTVDRLSEGKFYVCDVVLQPWAGPNWNHTLSAECSYCHKTIEIHLRAPLNIAKFAKDEACRIAILAHLRTEHPTTKKKKD
jgi:hypothetical protein